MANLIVNSSRHALLPTLVLGVCASVPFLGAVSAQGATYYVATTGKDSNPGTLSSPWRHPQRCTASPIRAGDTCIVRSGTYTDADGNGMVVWVYDRPTTPSGTASQPITIRSEKALGAVIVVPSNKNGWGFVVQRPYYVIEGFDISGGNYSGSSGAGTGVLISANGNGATIRSNSIHHIGRKACTNSTNAYSGVVIKGTSGALVERNRIYSIGRRRNGESGCSAKTMFADHGVYVSGASSPTLRRNVIYDSNRGYPIHAHGGTTTNLNVNHNTLHGTSSTIGHILLSSTIKTANIKNNTSSDANSAMIRLYNLSASGVVVSHNLSSTSIRYGNVSGVSFSNNIEKTNPAFISKSTNDFRLTSSSPVINRGTTSGVQPVPDGKPDSSAYEYSTQNSTASPLTPTGLKSS